MFLQHLHQKIMNYPNGPNPIYSFSIDYEQQCILYSKIRLMPVRRMVGVEMSRCLVPCLGGKTQINRDKESIETLYVLF